MTDQTSTIPKGWKITTLGEVAEKIVDNRGKTPPTISEGFELLEVNTISESRRTPDYSKVTKFVDEDTFKNWFRTGVVLKNDILIPTVGTIGNISFSKISRGAIAQNLIVIRTDTQKFEPLFVYYLLKNPASKNKLLNLDIGGVQPSIKVPHLLAMEILTPPIPEQRAIAEVLSSLDDKIELLREQNKILEATAQSIFKEWFVNFNFPDASGKMIESELGQIPKGWRVGKIKDFGEIVCGKTPSKENQDFFGGKIPFIKIPDMHGQVFINKTEDWLTEDGANTQKNKYIPVNSICVSCIATVGLVSITSEKSQTNQQINSIILSTEVCLEYLFLALKNIKEDLLAIGTGGSTTLNINTTTFSNIEMLFPNDATLENFHKVISPIFKKLNTDNSQIQTLSTLRDTLLPKLMKGEVRVEGFNN